MAIRFACACGKKLQARDEFAGRRMKCPSCKQTLDIPWAKGTASGPAGAAAGAAAPPQTPAPPVGEGPRGAEIHFEEVIEVMTTEERVILEPDEASAPSAAAMPKARPAPLSGAAPAAPAPGIFLTQTATFWRGDDQKLLNPESGRADVRDRSRAGFKALLGVAIAALIVVLVLFGPDLVNRLTSSTSSAQHADLDYVPADAFAFASVRVADLWNGPALTELGAQIRARITEEIRKQTGLAPSDVERVTVIVFEAHDLGLTPRPVDAVVGMIFGPGPPAGKKKGAPAGKGGPGVKNGAPGGEKKVVSGGDKKVVGGGPKGGPKVGGPKDGPPRGGFPGMPPPPMAEPSSEPQIAVLVTTVEAYDRRLLEGKFVPEAVTVYHKGTAFLAGGKKKGMDLLCLSDKQFVVATPGAMPTFLDRALKGNPGPLSDAIALARESPGVVVGINAPKEGLTRLPALLAIPGLNWKDAEPLLAVKSMTVALDDGEAVLADVRIRYAESAQADKAREAAQQLVDKAIAFLKSAHVWAVALTVQSKDAELQVKVQAKGLAPAAPMLFASQPADAAAARARSMSNLRRIGAAMLAYHKEHETLPPPAIGNNKGLSWRVALLPYLGHKALYDQFRLDEQWDSTHNQQLLGKMPDVYGPTSGIFTNRKTHYLVFSGPGTAFHGGKQSLADIKDGASVTMLVVESAPAVPWTAPYHDFFYTPKRLPPLGAQHADVFLALFADGAVHSLSRDFNPATLEGWITPAGGEGSPNPAGLAPPTAGGGRKSS